MSVSQKSSVIMQQHQQQQQQQHGGSKTFQALYTKHKTQKRKVWQDGRLVLQSYGAVLHAANPPPGGGDPALDTCAMQPCQLQAIRQGTLTHLETEKFLVQVEGPWQGSVNVPPSWGSNLIAVAQQPSASMQKILQRKFRKPAQKRPPPRPSTQAAAWQKRKRPLQPGELHRQFYGETMSHHQQQQHGTMPPNVSFGSQPTPMHGMTQESQRHPQTHYMQQTQHCGNNQSWTTTNQAPATSNQPTNHAALRYSHDASGHSTSLPRSATWKHPPNGQAPSTTRNYRQEALPEAPSSFGVPSRHPAQYSNPQGGMNPATHLGRRKNFVSNGFDPRGFYGEDGEEEEEEEEDEGGETPAQDQYSLPKASPTGPFRDYEQIHEALDGPECFAENAVQPPSTDEPNHQQQPDTLTTDDLLDLFGGDSTQPDNDTRNEGTASTAEKGKENSPPTQQEDDFALPPPSDSSDDEEEQ